MTEPEIETATALLAAARRGGTRITALDAEPESVAAGHAIQDRVAALLGEPIGGFKANAPPGEAPVRGAIYARMIFASPAKIAASAVPDLGVEGEIAFRFTRDLPARATDYSKAEVAEAVTALPAIEIVSGRLLNWQNQPPMAQLADCLNNGALVRGSEAADWRHRDIANLQVTAWVNGEKILQRQGGHPIGDPLAVATALANLQRSAAGILAGQCVTTGSCTGIRFLRPGERFAVEFEGLGRAEVEFTP